MLRRSRLQLISRAGKQGRECVNRSAVCRAFELRPQAFKKIKCGTVLRGGTEPYLHMLQPPLNRDGAKP